MTLRGKSVLPSKTPEFGWHFPLLLRQLMHHTPHAYAKPTFYQLVGRALAGRMHTKLCHWGAINLMFPNHMSMLRKPRSYWGISRSTEGFTHVRCTGGTRAWFIRLALN